MWYFEIFQNPRITNKSLKFKGYFLKLVFKKNLREHILGKKGKNN